MEYFTTQARAAQPRAAATAAAAPYLHLHSVLAGFSDLMAAVLGVQLRQVEAAPGEVWGPGENVRMWEVVE
jgi:Zn-dependent oligopeptidase